MPQNDFGTAFAGSFTDAFSESSRSYGRDMAERARQRKEDEAKRQAQEKERQLLRQRLRVREMDYKPEYDDLLTQGATADDVFTNVAMADAEQRAKVNATVERKRQEELARNVVLGSETGLPAQGPLTPTQEEQTKNYPDLTAGQKEVFREQLKPPAPVIDEKREARLRAAERIKDPVLKQLYVAGEVGEEQLGLLPDAGTQKPESFAEWKNRVIPQIEATVNPNNKALRQKYLPEATKSLGSPEQWAKNQQMAISGVTGKSGVTSPYGNSPAPTMAQYQKALNDEIDRMIAQAQQDQKMAAYDAYGTGGESAATQAMIQQAQQIEASNAAILKAIEDIEARLSRLGGR